jgi:uroporphyrinogen decarboxylase
VLVDATIDYLAMQAASGAQVLKLFESWAEGLSEPLFDRLVTKPHTAIIEGLRARGVTTPIIGFPRGAGTLVEDLRAKVAGAGRGARHPGSAALGQSIQKTKTIQGALDPLLLRAGGDALLKRVDQLLEQWGQGPYIFNLGHGILPDTPIAHVEAVLARVTGQRTPSDVGRAASSPSSCSISAGPTGRTRCGRSCSTCSAIRRSSACRPSPAIRSRP